MNIRSGPGTDYKYLGQILAGTRVELYDIAYGGGMAWGQYYGGWLCLDYVRLDNPSRFPLSEEGNWYVQIRYNSVPAYKGPGTQYSKVATYSRDTVVEVTGAAGQWYRTDKGWINADNCYYYSG
jgi:uncharacterized protein YraI